MMMAMTVTTAQVAAMILTLTVMTMTAMEHATLVTLYLL
jgi:hypothetical protein